MICSEERKARDPQLAALCACKENAESNKKVIDNYLADKARYDAGSGTYRQLKEYQRIWNDCDSGRGCTGYLAHYQTWYNEQAGRRSFLPKKDGKYCDSRHDDWCREGFNSGGDVYEDARQCKVDGIWRRIGCKLTRDTLLRNLQSYLRTNTPMLTELNGIQGTDSFYEKEPVIQPLADVMCCSLNIEAKSGRNAEVSNINQQCSKEADEKINNYNSNSTTNNTKTSNDDNDDDDENSGNNTLLFAGGGGGAVLLSCCCCCCLILIVAVVMMQEK